MIAVDTSVVIAAFASWHELHEQARRVLDRRPRLLAQAALESYSVLTRLPPPHRVPGEPVLQFIAARFREPFLVLVADQFRSLLDELHSRGITGGASYDALMAFVAREARATLLSCDRRAATTYALLETEVEFIG